MTPIELDLDRLHGIQHGDDEEYEHIATEFVDHRRWTVDYEVVFRHRESGELWAVMLKAAATENQESDIGEPYRVRPCTYTAVTYNAI